MASSQAHIGVLVHDDYQELEFWYPVLRFREAGDKVTVIGVVDEREHVSRLGYPVIPDIGIAAASAAGLDALILPGGGAPARIAGTPAMLQLVKDAAAGGAVIGALSEGTALLDAAGVTLGGRVVTAKGADELPRFYRAVAQLLGRAPT